MVRDVIAGAINLTGRSSNHMQFSVVEGSCCQKEDMVWLVWLGQDNNYLSKVESMERCKESIRPLFVGSLKYGELCEIEIDQLDWGLYYGCVEGSVWGWKKVLAVWENLPWNFNFVYWCFLVGVQQALHRDMLMFYDLDLVPMSWMWIGSFVTFYNGRGYDTIELVPERWGEGSALCIMSFYGHLPVPHLSRSAVLWWQRPSHVTPRKNRSVWAIMQAVWRVKQQFIAVNLAQAISMKISIAVTTLLEEPYLCYKQHASLWTKSAMAIVNTLILYYYLLVRKDVSIRHKSSNFHGLLCSF